MKAKVRRKRPSVPTLTEREYKKLAAELRLDTNGVKIGRMLCVDGLADGDVVKELQISAQRVRQVKQRITWAHMAHNTPDAKGAQAEA